jgi:hypothetical protein
MEDILTINPRMPSSPGKNIASVVSRFGKRLLGFIRQRVGNEADAEDILQDVWYQLTTTVDTEPIEQISGWLFRVARNKIIDRYRKKRPESLEPNATGRRRPGRPGPHRTSCWTTARTRKRPTCGPSSGRHSRKRWTSCRKNSEWCLSGTSWKTFPSRKWPR